MKDADYTVFAAARTAVTNKIDSFVTDSSGSGLAALVATLQQARGVDPGYPVMGGAPDIIQPLYRAIVNYINAKSIKEQTLPPAQRTIAFATFQWP
jgi:hypothetical protein